MSPNMEGLAAAGWNVSPKAAARILERSDAGTRRAS
jgi:hypothetical protein